MRIVSLALLLLGSPLLWAQAPASAPAPPPNSGGMACVLTPAQLNALLALSYDEIDQDMHGGFRALAHKGCELTAAMVLDSYVVSAPNGMTEDDKTALLFHAGQLYAYSGLSELAAQRFLQSLDVHETGSEDLAWNTYVLASVAFLQRNHEELLHQRQVLAEAKATPGNKMNLRVVDRFIQCYDKPYNEAYESCATGAK